MCDLICPKGKCTGCSACSSICPKKAISMIQDKKGFWRPQINESVCVECGACRKVCPVINKPTNYETTRAFAFQNCDEVRLNSTSGGFFYAVAQLIIKTGGVVCGAAFDDKMVLRHLFVDDIESLIKLQRSKYVQSTTFDVFDSIKQYLREKRKVLFVGTGCQVAAVKNFIGENDNLFLMDLVCYGVPSPGVFSEWLQYLNNKYDRVTDVRFRDKSYGYSSPNVRVLFNNGKYIESCRDSNLFTELFFKHLTIRESCFSCEFKTANRCSDITIGDLWSVGKFDRKRNDNKGASLVIPHSNKGELLCKKLCKLEMDLHYIVEYESKKMTECVKPSKSYDDFWKMYISFGFDKILSAYSPNNAKTKTKYIIKKIMNKTGISKVWYFRQKNKRWKNRNGG